MARPAEGRASRRSLQRPSVALAPARVLHRVIHSRDGEEGRGPRAATREGSRPPVALLLPEEHRPVVSALLPAFVLAGIAVAAAHRYRTRRRISRMRLSGGRKALVLYLADRGR